jgi:acrylyl-CoA reductase (NADPH)
MPRRIEAWHRLQSDLPLDLLEAMTIDTRLAEVPRLAPQILKGHVRGRVVVDVNG